MNSENFKRQPDFNGNILKVLQGNRPNRATLFELFLSKKHINYFSQTRLDEIRSEFYD